MFAQFRRWLAGSITRKLTALLIGFLALQALQLAVGISATLHVGHESGHLVNAAGKQRFRTFLLGNITRQVLTDGRWSPALRGEFDHTLASYEAAYAELEGYATTAFGHGRVLAALRDARATWEQDLRPLLSEFDPSSARKSFDVVRRYEEQSRRLVEKLDRFVGLLEENIAEDTRRLAIFQAVLLAFTIMAGLFAIHLVRRDMVGALKELNDGAMAVAAGAYDRRIPVSASDEVGQLAASFNGMAEQLGHKSARVRALNEATMAFTRSESLEEVLDEVLWRAVRLLDCRGVALWLFDATSGTFGEVCTWGLPRALAVEARQAPPQAVHAVFDEGLYIASRSGGNAQAGLSAGEEGQGVRARLCVPISSHEADVGVLCLYREDRDGFLPFETELLTAFSYFAAGAIQSARRLARSERLAATDPLTGLPNRRALDARLADEIARIRRHERPLCVVMLDIDHFKRVNDTYLHPGGDAVLRQLAAVLRQQVRDVDFVARYGGEEFCLVLPETDVAAGRLVAERIRHAAADTAVQAPGGCEIRFTVSLGVAHADEAPETAAALLAQADQALYTAKSEGRNRVVVYGDMLKAELERDPNRIAELLNHSLDNVEAVVTAVDLRASFLRNHSGCTLAHALRLGERLDLPGADREALRLACLLHDVGIITIPEGILNKKGALTEHEWRLVRQHPVAAAQMLAQVRALSPVVPVVRHHHERYDGSGYPDGLKGEQIPRLARVLAVVDAYCAMTAERPQRAALTSAQAQKRLLEGAGRQFDPGIVKVFVRLLGDAV
jgi:diguanylate cyclase (GGDEF)-like protein